MGCAHRASIRVEACTEDRCDGDVLLTCAAGLGMVETDCAARVGGGTCRVIDDGTTRLARCDNDTMECTDGAMQCAGAVLRTCIEERWFDLDCGEFLDATCSEVETGRFRCVSSSWPP